MSFYLKEPNENKYAKAYQEKLYKEICRFAPYGELWSNCVLNVDIGFWFPPNSYKTLFFDFTLLEKLEDLQNAFPKEDSFNNIKKFNHRYPNKHTVTLSRKLGRKLCRTGFPVFDTKEAFTKHKYFVAKVIVETLDGKEITRFFIFKININFEHDNQISNFDIHFKSVSEESEEILLGTPEYNFSTQKMELITYLRRKKIEKNCILFEPEIDIRPFDHNIAINISR